MSKFTARRRWPGEVPSASPPGQMPDPQTVAEILARFRSPDRERWERKVRAIGACRRPVRLKGKIVRDGEVAYSTYAEPDGVLLVRCGNRRHEVCPSCSHQYRGDMWQLLYAGLAGGRKGISERVRSHPQVFATLTAPSFGAVHTRHDDGRPCRCGQPHPEDDPDLGAPLDPSTYDYPGAVAWNFRAGALWSRFTGRVLRGLAAHLGLTEKALRARLRVSYAKVAEFQRRGLVHFHAIIRLDGPEGPADPPRVVVSAATLAEVVNQAAAEVQLHETGPHGRRRTFRFGRQLDVRPLADATDERQVDPEAVAAYISKYATKGAHEGITARHVDLAELRHRGVPAHLVELAAAAIRLDATKEYAGIGAWAHMLGFRGHPLTKSHRYSVTLSELRRARLEHQRQLAGEDLEDDSTPVVGEWSYAGMGYLSAGDATLAAAIEAEQELAREALLETRPGRRSRQRPLDGD